MYSPIYRLVLICVTCYDSSKIRIFPFRQQLAFLINSKSMVLVILPYIQIVLSVLLVVAILLQQSEAGLGAAFGGSGDGGTYRTRRGFEKILFNATIAIAILFALSAFIVLILS